MDDSTATLRTRIRHLENYVRALQREHHEDLRRLAAGQAQLRQLNEEIEARYLHVQRLDLLGELVHEVVHDFKSVLTIITSQSQLLMLQVDDDNAKAGAQRIDRAARRAATISNRLLRCCQRRDPRPEMVEMNGYLTDLADLLEHLESARLRVVCSPARRPLLIRIDPVLLDQLVLNLAVNARDAVGENGLLRMSLRQAHLKGECSLSTGVAPAGRYVVLSVADNGGGMAPQVLAQAFSPFYTTKAAGTGLGLTTVGRIARQVNAHIQVDSRLGVGTRFQVYFPEAALGKSEESAPAGLRVP